MSAEEARRAAAERPCHDYAARGSTDVRYEAVDSEEQRFGPARHGYYRAMRRTLRSRGLGGTAVRSGPTRILPCNAHRDRHQATAGGGY